MYRTLANYSQGTQTIREQGQKSLQSIAAIARYDRDPKAAGFTLLMEINALAFNPRMHLFSSGTAYDLMARSANQAAFDELEQLLQQLQWAIYHVQRTYKQLIGKKGNPTSTPIATWFSSMKATKLR